eukprot:12933320-Prorocentrum_lima.AAC.1
MISKLDMKHSRFSHRVSAVKYSREARTPSLETARQLEEVIMDELRMLAADEKAAVKKVLLESERSSSWKRCCCGTEG